MFLSQVNVSLSPCLPLSLKSVSKFSGEDKIIRRRRIRINLELLMVSLPPSGGAGLEGSQKGGGNKIELWTERERS